MSVSDEGYRVSDEGYSVMISEFLLVVICLECIDCHRLLSLLFL